METGLLLHPKTRQNLQRQLVSAAHGLLLVGQAGSGKASLARQLAAERHGRTADEIINMANILYIQNDVNKGVSIEAVRTIEHFLALRTVKGEPRTVVIEDAQQLSVEAQNALLKIIEEPPAATLFILTAESEANLLPTIRSRVTTVAILAPLSEELHQYFLNAGFEDSAIKRAELISGGLPGRMQTLLTAEADHPLSQAAAMARDCIQRTGFERLCLVEGLAKNRQLSLDTLSMLQQMAKLSLASGKPNRIWPVVLRSAYEAGQQLQQNAQPKLVLTDLMLKLSV